MEINRIYYNNKKECYFLALSRDTERFYGRTSRITKPSYLDYVMGLDNDSKETFAFTDKIEISFNNIYNPRIDEDFSNYELVYVPTLSQIEEFESKDDDYYKNRTMEG